MKAVAAAILCLGLTFAASAYPYPGISNDPNVQLNQWTYRYNEAIAKAAALNRPVMIAFVNQGLSANCQAWNDNILSNPDCVWDSFLVANPMILIWVDQQSQSMYTSPSWTQLLWSSGIWNDITAYPEIVMLHPNGTFSDQFSALSSLSQNPGFYLRVRNTTNFYPYNPAPGTIGFSAAAATETERDGAMTVQVARTGGSSGAQTFQYATADGTAMAGTDYIGATGTLSWADNDAANKPFTVTLFNDAQWRMPTNRTFTLILTKTAGTATLGVSTQTVTVVEDDPDTAMAAGVPVTPIGNSNAVSAVADNSGDGGASIKLGGAGLLPDGDMSGIEWGVTGIRRACLRLEGFE